MGKTGTRNTGNSQDSTLNLLPEYLGMLEGCLGRLVMRFSLIHFVLEIHLWRILDMNSKNGRILTEDLPLSNLAERFCKTAEAKYPPSDDLKALRRAIRALGKVNTRRNALVHAFWSFPNDGPPLIFPKKGQLMSVNAPTVADINQLVKETDRVKDELFTCLKQLVT